MDLEAYLKKFLNDENAKFKKDQKEAIELLLKNHKVLVVEKTGWGKSMVYFITTKIKRLNGCGPTIIISPLLALIRNQIYSAEKYGLKARSINSTNISEWSDIEKELKDDKCDILFISPERLAAEDFKNTIALIPKGIGALVIDEAHCISDWGHDFRPDYKRINNIIKMLPNNIPVLATTATANSRVVKDICEQIGEEIQVLRGTLMRKSLILQNITYNSEEEKLTALINLIKALKGSGIVYCTTTGKCILVAKWLQKFGIKTKYYFGTNMKNDYRIEVEKLFFNNDIKVVVATNALGMGYDKPDIRFIIHYEKPKSLIEYYQQIGRAGRDGKEAHAILLNCKVDDDIQLQFIKNSLPKKEKFEEVYTAIEKSDLGLKEAQISREVNIGGQELKTVLKILDVKGSIYCENKIYKSTVNGFIYDEDKFNRVLKNKSDEFDKLNEYIDTTDCLMNFIQKQLDDNIIEKCNICSNCNSRLNLINITDDIFEQAYNFLNNTTIEIPSRKKWSNKTNIEKSCIVENGIAMSRYRQGILGNRVYEDRYIKGVISEELIMKSIECIKNSEIYNKIKWVTWVPSIKNPKIVPSFAKRIAEGLELPFREVIFKDLDTKQQKYMKNSYQQESNIINAFRVSKDNFDQFSEPVLLIDDIVNSRWTFTVCGYKLLKNGSGLVYPFALAYLENGGV